MNTSIKNGMLFAIWVGGGTLLVALMWEAVARFLIVPSTDVVANPRMWLGFSLMGLIFGGMMWATTTMPSVPKPSPRSAMRSLRIPPFFLWFTGLFLLFEAMFRDFSIGGVGVTILVSLFVTSGGWALLAQRAERAANQNTRTLRLAFAERLVRAVESIANTHDDDDDIMLFQAAWRVGRAIRGREGWWPIQDRAFAVGSLLVSDEMVALLRAKGVPDGTLLEVAKANTAARSLAQSELDPEATERVIARIEALVQAKGGAGSRPNKPKGSPPGRKG